MKPRKFLNQRGLSLIELAVSLSLIGLMSTVAVIYLSSGQTALRSTLHDFRFDMELAKNEAVTRNDDILVDFFLDTPTVDYNGDGLVDRKDRCYVIYQDLSDPRNDAYDPGVDERITSTHVDPSLRFPVFQQLKFLPLGQLDVPSIQTIRMESVVRNDCDPLTPELECLVTPFEVDLHPVGRIQVKDDYEQHPDFKQHCEPIDYCL